MTLPADPLVVADDIALSDSPGQAPPGPDVVVRGRRQLVMRRLRRNKAAVTALVVLVLLFVAAFVSPIIYEAITGFTYQRARTSRRSSSRRRPTTGSAPRRSAATCSR